MSLLRWLRTPLIYLRKETISTGLVRYTENAESSEQRNTDNYDPKDRSRVIPVETSIRYLKSDAYKKAYGEEPVWRYYRRNFRGQLPPETRKSCVIKQRISNASPCPICRDEYLVLDYKNIDLLKQFIGPGGEILETKKTGICQVQHHKLILAIARAKNYGMISHYVPHRNYNYNYYCKK